MAFIDWSPKLSMGMKDIDEQHRQFIGIINRTKKAVDAGAQREEQKDIIAELVDYGRYHFETEENYFVKFSYPYAAEHKEEHAKLLSKVLHFSDRFEAGENITPALLTFLKKWLATHLKKQDAKYSRYFKRMGYI